MLLEKVPYVIKNTSTHDLDKVKSLIITSCGLCCCVSVWLLYIFQVELILNIFYTSLINVWGIQKQISEDVFTWAHLQPRCRPGAPGAAPRSHGPTEAREGRWALRTPRWSVRAPCGSATQHTDTDKQRQHVAIKSPTLHTCTANTSSSVTGWKHEL